MALAREVDSVSVAKEDLYRLVDRLSAKRRQRARVVLEALVEEREDPVLLLLATAPADDEPLTPEEEDAIEAGLEDLRQGRVMAWSEVRAKYLKDGR
jgi:predicted transcriptional regulator